MSKNLIVVMFLVLASLVSLPLDAAVETPIGVGQTITNSVQPGETQAYSFSVDADDGYCVKVAPTQGQPDLYVYDANFRLVGKSVMPGLEGYSIEKVFAGASPTGAYHIMVIGEGDNTSQYEISLSNAPFISKISASTGLNGSKLKIWGRGFGDEVGTSYVKFGDTQATNYISWKNIAVQISKN